MTALKPVDSKMMQAWGYDPASRTLAVRFGPGKVYHYADVPPEVEGHMRDAKSVGIAFALHVRGKFQHTIVIDEESEAK